MRGRLYSEGWNLNNNEGTEDDYMLHTIIYYQNFRPTFCLHARFGIKLQVVSVHSANRRYRSQGRILISGYRFTVGAI